MKQLFGELERLEGRVLLAAGALDSVWASDGIVTSGFHGASYDVANAVAVQKDGKVILAGRASDGGSELAVVRLGVDGKPDPAFGNAGRVLVRLGAGNAIARDVVIDKAGRICVAATLDGELALVRFKANGAHDFTLKLAVATYDDVRIALQRDQRMLVAGSNENGLELFRVNGRGQFDTSFGVGGRVSTALANGRVALRGLVVRSDGRILAVGDYLKSGLFERQFVIARYLPSGQPDAAWHGGTLISPIPYSIDDVALTPDNKLVLSGQDGIGHKVARLRAKGTVDRGFGEEGIVRIDGLEHLRGGHLALQKDGRIVLGGTIERNDANILVAARLNLDGSADTRFEKDGRALVSAPLSDWVNDVAIDPQGRIVVAGEAGRDMLALRWKADGSTDTGFNARGKAIVAMDGPANERIFALARQADGKIIAVGGADENGLGSAPGIIVRYHADGELDGSFGDGGRVVSRLGGQTHTFRSVLVLADGRIAAAGPGLGIAMFNADGSVDQTFGQSGVVSLPYAVQALILTSGGNLLAAGSQEWIARLNPDGSLDPSFAGDGMLELPFNAGPKAIVEQPDGRIPIAGDFDRGNRTYAFGVARFNANGTLDESFGDGGRRLVEAGGHWGDSPTSIALQGDGKIIVGGAKSYYSNSDWLLIRLTAGGDLDGTFGAGGLVVSSIGSDGYVDFGLAPEVAMAVAVDGAGRIIVAGTADIAGPQPLSNQTRVAVARYLAEGSLDPTFGDGGVTITDAGGDSGVNAMLMLEGGALIVGGYAEPFGAGRDFLLARYRLSDPSAVRAEVIDGTLVVTGTPDDDVIRIWRTISGGVPVYVDGLGHLIDVGQFSKVLMRGMGGDDVLDSSALGAEHIMLGGPLSILVTIEGGAGDDSITGGNWHDVLHGGRGDDTIFAGDGNDTVFAHRGQDQIHGGNGNDYLNGGPDGDSVFGDSGNDQIYALDNLIDQITGGDGFDRATGDVIDALLDVEGAL